MRLSFKICSHLVGQCLWVGGYSVGVYPISYLTSECVEDFCEDVNWEFDHFADIDFEGRYIVSGIIKAYRLNHAVPYRRALRNAQLLCQQRHKV